MAAAAGRVFLPFVCLVIPRFDGRHMPRKPEREHHQTHDPFADLESPWDGPVAKKKWSPWTHCTPTVVLATMLACLFAACVLYSLRSSQSDARAAAVTTSVEPPPPANIMNALDATQRVMIIVHAESAQLSDEAGAPGLLPAGVHRAQCLAQHFATTNIQHIFAPKATGLADEDKLAERCTETVQPLADRISLRVDQSFAPKATLDLAQTVQSSAESVILISWYLSSLLARLSCLGGDALTRARILVCCVFQEPRPDS